MLSNPYLLYPQDPIQPSRPFQYSHHPIILWIICSDAVQIVLLSLQCPSPDTSMNSDWYWSIVHPSLHTPNVIPITLYAFVLLSSTSLPGNGKSNIKNWNPNLRTTGDLLITFTGEWLPLFLESIGWDQITDAYIAYCCYIRYIHLKSMNLIKHLSTSHRTASLNIFMIFLPSPLIKTSYTVMSPVNSWCIMILFDLLIRTILIFDPFINSPFLEVASASFILHQKFIKKYTPNLSTEFPDDYPCVSGLIHPLYCTFHPSAL